MNKIDHVIQIYRVPKEVVVRMGPLPKASGEATRAGEAIKSRAPLF